MPKFDKIYCIHIVDAPERKKIMEQGFNRIFPNEDIKFFETVRKPWLNNEVGRLVVNEREANPNSAIKLPVRGSYYDWWKNGNENMMGVLFDCAYNLYSVLKMAQLKKYEHIAIFEDDFQFIGNDTLIHRYIDSMPADYDMIRFYSSGYDSESLKDGDALYVNYKDADPMKVKLFNGGIGFLALSKRGINAYLSYLEEKEFISDVCLMDYNYWADNQLGLNCYFPTALLYKPDYNNEKIKSTVIALW